MADRSIPLPTAAARGQSPNEAPVALTRSSSEVMQTPSAPTASDEMQRRVTARQGVAVGAANQPPAGSQRYVQSPTTRSNDNRRAAVASATLLSSFRMLQTNDQVTLVEADGSVYSGQIRAATAAGAATPARARDDAAAAQRWFFSASGVSRSLRQPVTIEAYLEPGAPATVNQPAPTPTAFQASAPGRTQLGGPGVQAPAPRVSSGVTAGAEGGALATFPALQNFRVTGQARVGATNVVPINAIPAAP
jgi:hypothetical protein